MNIFSKAVGFAILVALPFSVASQTGSDIEVMPAGQEVAALTNDVSSNGAFSYSVPFDLPEFRGLVPNVSLAYNSSNKAFGYERNLSGIGWNLTGFSMIELKTPGGGTPIYGSVQSNSINIFTLDGEPLLACTDGGGNLLGSNDGSYPSEYIANAPSASCTAGGNFASLREDYRKIVKLANSWEITNPDGTKYTYQNLQALGAAATAPTFTSKARFLLTSITDVNGNSVALSYYIEPFANGYATRPATIIYGGDGDGNTQGYKVQFMYGDRGYDITYALGWNKLGRHSKILEAVTVTLNDQPIRAYDMTYELTAETARHRLASVTEYGDDFVYHAAGTVTGSALPATTFQYAEEQFRYTGQWGTTKQWGPERVHSYLTIADFDNDGLDEIYSPAIQSYYSLPESLIKFSLDISNPSSSPYRTNLFPGIAALQMTEGNNGWRRPSHAVLGVTAVSRSSAPNASVGQSSLIIGRSTGDQAQFGNNARNRSTWTLQLYNPLQLGATLPTGNILQPIDTYTWTTPIWSLTPYQKNANQRMGVLLGQFNRDSEIEIILTSTRTIQAFADHFQPLATSNNYHSVTNASGNGVGPIDLNGDGLSDFLFRQEEDINENSNGPGPSE